MRRVFFLGFGKTGTSTLSRTMSVVGLGSMHHGKWHKWSISHDKEAFENCKVQTFNARTGMDIEWLYDTFPNSFFILNSRNLKEWLVSWWNQENRKWIKKKDGNLTHKANEEAWVIKKIIQRNGWHSNVVKFFKDKPNFCSLDLGNENNKMILKKLSKATGKNVPKLYNKNRCFKSKIYVKNPKVVQRVLEKMDITLDQYDLLFIENLKKPKV